MPEAFVTWAACSSSDTDVHAVVAAWPLTFFFFVIVFFNARPTLQRYNSHSSQ